MVEWSNGQKMVNFLYIVKYLEINAANKGLEGWMTGRETSKASDIWHCDSGQNSVFATFLTRGDVKAADMTIEITESHMELHEQRINVSTETKYLQKKTEAQMRKLCCDISFASRVFPCCIEVPNFTATHPIVYILLFLLSNFFCPVSSVAKKIQYENQRLTSGNLAVQPYTFSVGLRSQITRLPPYARCPGIRYLVWVTQKCARQLLIPLSSLLQGGLTLDAQCPAVLIRGQWCLS